VHITNPNWGAALVEAYDTAVLNAQSRFLVDIYGKFSFDAARSYFYDGSDAAKKFPDEASKKTASALGVIRDKFAALAEAKLDKKLKEEGINPDEYRNKSAAQKKSLLMKKFVKDTVTLAAHEISGLTVVQTFHGSDERGNDAIGVLMMYSPAIRQLAYDIAHNRVPLLTGTPSTNIRDMIPADSAVLNEALGIRIGFDAKGRPCIISYGQYASGVSGKDAAIIEDEDEFSETSAFTQAEIYITNFINSHLEYYNFNSIGSVAERTLVKDGDGNITGLDTMEFVKLMNKNSKLRGKRDVLGSSTIKTWSHVTPEGHRFSGIVRAWTVDTLAGGQAVRNWQPQVDNKPVDVRQTPSVPQKAGVKRGPAQDLNGL
jgi:hypothetical protein